MFITILAHIIVTLGFAALAALIVTIAILTLKKVLSKIKEKLSNTFGGTVVAISMERVANEAIKEAKEKNNVTKIAELEAMVNKPGVAFATADENGDIIKDSIEIIQSENNNSEIDKLLGDNGGCLVVTA